jgi:drug/metabolite transporter (DMT)-like permease
MNRQTLISDVLLLLTATIWGFAFVAQRVGMEYVGPFTYNGIRFALGSLVLVPFVARKAAEGEPAGGRSPINGGRTILLGGGLAGFTLFVGASLQQVGLVYTTAGNAGFITGLYVVIVPLMGLLFRQRANGGTWVGALLAAAGLYFLSITDQFTIAFGDFLELAGAFFWAAHVLIIGWLAPRMNPLKLALAQFAACSFFSLIAAAALETLTLEALILAAAAILYGGVLSVGVAYTLQVVAQRTAHPAHAAILLSLEAVFAALGGWLFLEESLSAREMLGCGLMLAGMLLSQLWGLVRLSAPGRTALKQASG